MTGIANGAASYGSHVSALTVAPEVVDDIYLGYHCKSVLSSLDGNATFKSKDWINGRVKLYPIANIENGNDESTSGAFQLNGRSEELGISMTNREFRVCHEWQFHMKVDRGEYELLKSDYERFKKVVSEYIDRTLDVRREMHGLYKIAAFASPLNQGTSAGYSGIDLGDQATPLHGKNPQVAEDLAFSLSTLFSENQVMCDMNNIIMVVPPFLYEGLVKSQKGLDICCSKENAQVTGMISMASGISFVKSNRLPYTVVGGKRIYKAIAADASRIGSPHKMLYMEWQKLGHDMVLLGDVIYDTHVLDPLAVAVAHVSAEV